MKLIFMGTPDFAVPSLERLLADGHEVLLAVTQPDKPVGRKQVLTPPPVKVCAESHGIPVYQPASMKKEETWAYLSGFPADAMIVVAYGKILPAAVLHMTPLGCINVHGSLLPRYRGAAPVQWAILNGDTETGVTTMQLDEGVDTGDILLMKRFMLDDRITGGELFDRLAQEGAELLSCTLTGLADGTVQPRKQPAEGACYAGMLSKSMSPLDWSKPARVLHNQVRGMNPWPVASTVYEGKTLKIYGSRVAESAAGQPGTVLSLSPLVVACGEGTALELQEVQYEGARRMAAADFLRGHPMQVGERLGAQPQAEHGLERG